MTIRHASAQVWGTFLVASLVVTISDPVTAQEAASAGQAAQRGSAPVSVVNTPKVEVVNTPLLVSGTVNDPDNPARNPFQTRICKTFGITGCFATDRFDVDSTKRLVIENVSVDCGLTPGTAALVSLDIRTTVGGQEAPHYLVPVETAANASFRNFAAAQMTKIYADPGTTVIIESLSGASSGSCDATLSGYTITP